MASWFLQSRARALNLNRRLAAEGPRLQYVLSLQCGRGPALTTPGGGSILQRADPAAGIPVGQRRIRKDPGYCGTLRYPLLRSRVLVQEARRFGREHLDVGAV